MRQLSALFIFLLLSHLQAAQEDSDKTYLEFQKLIASESSHEKRRIFNSGEGPEVWAQHLDESPTLIDTYIRSGYHMHEIIRRIMEDSDDAARDPKVVANYYLRDYIFFFSFNLAYYDPVLSEEKKREAAQAIISALRARPADGLGNFIGAQSDPLVALGYNYLFSSWRHRPEVFEYVKTVEFTDHINFNKDRVTQLVRLHEGAMQDRGSLPIPRPDPGEVFPVHPAARARAEAAAQAEQEQKRAIPAPEPAPAPVPAPPPPPAASAPAPAPATPPAKPSHASWWILGALAALGAVIAIRKKKVGR